MDDRRAALLLSVLALAGGAARFALSPPPEAAPGDVRLVATDTPPASALGAAARQAARLARPLARGERIDVNRADAAELTRLPHVGPALAQRIVAWRDAHGAFQSLAALDSVPGIGAKLLETLRPCVTFSGQMPEPP